MVINVLQYFEQFVFSHARSSWLSRRAGFRPLRFRGRKLARAILRLPQPHISKIAYQRCVLTQAPCVNPRIDLPRPHLIQQEVLFSPCLQTTSLTRYLIGSPTGLMSSTAALRSSSTVNSNITEVIVINKPVAIFVQAAGEPSEPRIYL